MLNPSGNEKTYLKKRKCKHCSTSIPDQAHQLTEFCKNKLLADNTVKSCKDDYHIALRKISELVYSNLVAYHKKINKSIVNMVTQKGSIVTIDDLDQFGILLNRAIEVHMPPSQKGSYYFVAHEITQINVSKYKISTHEYTF